MLLSVAGQWPSVALGGRVCGEGLVPLGRHLHGGHIAATAEVLRCQSIPGSRGSEAQIAVRMIEGLGAGLLDRWLRGNWRCGRRG